MALTVDLTGDWLKSHGNEKSTQGTITFDSSYLTGGEVLTAAAVGLGSLDSLHLEAGEDGHVVEWVRTNQTTGLLRVRGGNVGNTSRPPTLVVDEIVTVGSVSDVGALKYRPSYIVSIEVIASQSVTGFYHVIPTGETPLTLQCAVTFTTGILTFLNTDDVDIVRVTYFPQQVDGLFTVANLIVDESHTAAEDSFTLTNRAIAVQCIYDQTDNVLMPLVPVGEAPGALEVAVDIDDGSSGTLITKNTAENANDLDVTYLRHSGLASGAAQINDADITLTGTDPEKWNFETDGSETNLVVPGLGTHCVGEETATNQDIPISGPQGTIAENVARWLPETNEFQTQQTGVMTTLAMPWFTVPAAILQEVGGEVPNGKDLSGMVVRFRATGR